MRQVRPLDLLLALSDTEAADTGLQRLVNLPEFNIAVFALLLNYPWEFLQVPFFEGMQDSRHWDAVLFCSRAAAGDAVVALVAYWAVALVVRSRHWVLRPTRGSVPGFIAAAVVITVGLEWAATDILNRWQYSPAMPVVPGTGTGLLPLLQWILLPPLIVWFVRRQLT